MTPVSAPAPSGLPLAGTGVDAAATGAVLVTRPGAASTPHHGLCMAVHVHSTRDERLACQADHDAAMARLLLAGEVA